MAISEPRFRIPISTQAIDTRYIDGPLRLRRNRMRIIQSKDVEQEEIDCGQEEAPDVQAECGS